jgi:hypothetical protein
MRRIESIIDSVPEIADNKWKVDTQTRGKEGDEDTLEIEDYVFTIFSNLYKCHVDDTQCI